MKRSVQLRQERSTKIDAQTAFAKKIQDEKRKMTPDEVTQFRTQQTEIDNLTSEIEVEEKLEENQRTQNGKSVTTEGDDSEKREKRKLYADFDFSKALRSAPTGNFDGVEKEVHDIAVEEMRANGKSAPASSFTIPSDMVRASAQTVSEDSGNYGGQLVVSQQPRPVAGFLPKLFLEQMGATVLTGVEGGTLPLPVVEEYDFGWYAETATISSQKKTITGPVASAKRAGAVVLISNRLLNQSSLPVRQMVMNMLGAGAAKCLNGAAISGTGLSNDPTGLINMTGILTSSQSDDAAATWARVTELQGLIKKNDSTEQSLGYLLDPVLEASMMTLKKDEGSGLFLSQDGKIGGYKSVATSLVPSIAAAGGNPELHHLIFGDFSQMFVVQWGGISFVVDPVSAADSNSLKVVVNMDADVQVANKKAFAINSWLSV
ncbi:phage major capsid protein [Flavobacterium sp. CYK-4]|uniref:phage major capsid protein n=1 Tax=Flavobacterium lotistagni TaxID=2709660 RepID=UPI0014091BA3|nr:phage major capsid protein [Flavobacterium lotistagni]NHM08001.1 phage major capsid protein [Flavobacterium lotistagni]